MNYIKINNCTALYSEGDIMSQLSDAAQNIYLQAVSFDFETVFIGAFHDKEVKEVVDLPDKEQPLFSNSHYNCPEYNTNIYLPVNQQFWRKFVSKKEKLKSVLTCDMEGRIETFGDGSVAMFGYDKQEVIGKRRVSLFSPGKVVLEHVPNWLKIASETGEFRTRTVFVRKNGTQFPAEISITPTFQDGQQIGYCGVTEELDDVEVEDVFPKISLMTSMFTGLVITRAPFLTAIIVPILIGGAWVATQKLTPTFPIVAFGLVLLSGILLHLAANTFNDYYDWQSGTDQANNDYFLPYTGGSRSIELGLISPKQLFRVAFVALLLSAMIGLYLSVISGIGIFVFGLVGAFSAYFYTAPPLRLAARRGLGELLIILNFGPLATAGTVYALTGQVTTMDFLIGIPIGLLTVAILWINQFPDLEPDRETGKINLVVVLGRQRARWVYPLLMLTTFGLTLAWVLSGALPLGALLILGGLPFAIFASNVILKEYAERSLVRANIATIQLHLFAGLLMAAGLLWSTQIASFLGA